MAVTLNISNRAERIFGVWPCYTRSKTENNPKWSRYFPKQADYCLLIPLSSTFVYFLLLSDFMILPDFLEKILKSFFVLLQETVYSVCFFKGNSNQWSEQRDSVFPLSTTSNFPAFHSSPFSLTSNIYTQLSSLRPVGSQPNNSDVNTLLQLGLCVGTHTHRVCSSVKETSVVMVCSPLHRSALGLQSGFFGDH